MSALGPAPASRLKAGLLEMLVDNPFDVRGTNRRAALPWPGSHEERWIAIGGHAEGAGFKPAPT